MKARALGPGSRAGVVFSDFRSFDFDVAVLITFDSSTCLLLWAREVLTADLETAGRFSRHVNGRLIPVATGAKLGMNITSRFDAVLST